MIFQCKHILSTAFEMAVMVQGPGYRRVQVLTGPFANVDLALYPCCPGMQSTCSAQLYVVADVTNHFCIVAFSFNFFWGYWH